MGTHVRRFCRAPPLFSLRVQLVVLVNALVKVSYSLISFLFAVLLLTVPPCPAICKSGGARAPVPCGVGAGVYDHVRNTLNAGVELGARLTAVGAGDGVVASRCVDR